MNRIGIDSGASFTRIWDGRQEVLKLKTPPNYTEYLQFLHRILRGYEPLETLVIALPAVIKERQVAKAPNLGKGWIGSNIEADIRALLNITGDLFIHQDTEAAGYAIQGQELSDMDPTMLITLSTGVGGVLVTDKYVLPLEVGHMPLNLSGENRQCGCGQSGCAEADLSGSGIAHYFGRAAEQVEDSAFWEKYGVELGQFFLVLTALFKLKQILLIGGVSQRLPLFLQHTKRYLSEHLKSLPEPTIRLSELGDNAGVYGTYRLAALHSKKSANQPEAAVLS